MGELEDGIGWAGPPCPECGRELDVETLASQGSVNVAYSCPEHGLVSILHALD